MPHKYRQTKCLQTEEQVYRVPPLSVATESSLLAQQTLTLNANEEKKNKSKKQKHPQLLLDNSRNVRVGQGSGEAGGTGKGGEGADWEAVIGGVGEGEQKEKEEEDPQQIGGEDSESVRVLQSCADGRETHVVTEGVAKYRTNQVACNRQKKTAIYSHWLTALQLPSASHSAVTGEKQMLWFKNNPLNPVTENIKTVF